MNEKKVGIVIRRTSALSFEALLEDDAFIQLDDVLVCKSSVKDGSDILEIKFYGIVEDVGRYLEGVEKIYQEVKAKEGIIPVNPVYIAKVNVTRVEPQFYVPPKPGDEVFRALDEDREKALFFDDMDIKIPAGLAQDGLPVYINYNFLNGKDGAHLSISGMSGVATKTSYSLFLINSIIQSSKNLPKFIIFNIKGKDLLFLDKHNKRFEEKDKKEYEAMGLSPKPFDDIAFYCPPSAPNSNISKDAPRYDVKLYGFDMLEFAKHKLIEFMFTDNKEISNLSYVIERVANKLYSLYLEAERSGFDELIDDKASKSIVDLEGLKEHLQNIYDGKDQDKETYKSWFGSNTSSQTIEAFLRRFSFAVKYIKDLIKYVKNTDIESLLKKFDNISELKTVNVIDISDLHSIGKMFVVGTILYNIFKKREESGISEPKIFVLLDELNRYAPRDGWSPIKDVLLDIAERGRSLGVILMGAQQTASEIEKRIIANSAIKVVGRLDTSELSAEEYGFLSKTMRQRVSMLKKGSMVLYQPDIPSPVMIHIPMPPWATRKEEVKEDYEKAIRDIFDNFS